MNFRQDKSIGAIEKVQDCFRVKKKKKKEERKFDKQDGNWDGENNSRFYPTQATQLSPEFLRVTEKKGLDQFQDSVRCEERWGKVK